ncbi:MAG: hypothetical protein QUS14_18065 [Pyrinomonadaceae bacterium]|nr:hypothetical protein [Pyrinomonadaceae bacterium]
MKFAKVKEMLPSRLSSLLAVAAAALLILAFPDFEFWFLAWVALAPLLVAVDRGKESVAGSFIAGWIFGVVFFFGTCWWLTFAPITYAGFPAAVAYFLLLCVCAVVAVFPGIFAALMAVLLRRFGSTMMLVAPIVWVFTEFLRYWLTGNNWNAVGYSQAFSGYGSMFAQIGGVLMTSGVVLCGSSLIAFVISGYQRYMDDPKTAPLFIVFLYSFLGYFVFLDPRAARSAWEVPKVDVRLPVVGAVFLPLIGFTIFALVYDYRSATVDPTDIAATVVALQPNVPMSGLTYEKWQELRQRHVRMAEAELAKLDERRTTNDEPPVTVIFPESPMNFM